LNHGNFVTRAPLFGLNLKSCSQFWSPCPLRSQWRRNFSFRKITSSC